ncbi:hypothetical protein diail_2598 [Diaporthe ilicicola]|nr:hypothetical protein diail_2598 [Diaporthe ilicicola]
MELFCDCNIEAMYCLKSKIRVNAVCPSWVDTPMNHATIERVPQMEQLTKAISPLGRVASTEEVVDYISFLCSPSATCMMHQWHRFDHRRWHFFTGCACPGLQVEEVL